MILMEPEQTPYDWRFSFLGVPVRVHPWFWLVSALLSWGFAELGIQYVFLAMMCVFVSILIHEMGHVMVGRVFGSDGHIVLYSFGGLAVGSSQVPGRWQRVAVFLAGPAAQLVLLYLPIRLAVYYRLIEAPSLAVRVAIYEMLFINLVWALVNLLPVWPLDGGQATREILTWVNRQEGVRWAMVLSLVISAIIAINSLIVSTGGKSFIPFMDFGGMWSTLLFGMLAYQSWLELQQLGRQDRWDRTPWER